MHRNFVFSSPVVDFTQHNIVKINRLLLPSAPVRSSHPAIRGSLLDLAGAAACRAAVVAPLSALSRHVAATQPLRPGAVQLAAVGPEVCSAAGVGAKSLLAAVLWTTRTRPPLLVRSAQPLQVVPSASRHAHCTSQSTQISTKCNS